MIHPQPTSVLLFHPDYEARWQPREHPGPLLAVLVHLRGLRAKPATPATDTPSDPASAESVSLQAHGGGHSPRVRAGLGGRIQQARGRRGARALRRRDDIHSPGRRAHRRGR